MDTNFKGKVAIITGASSGISETTAIKFAEEGASVVLVASRCQKQRPHRRDGGRAQGPWSSRHGGLPEIFLMSISQAQL